MSDRPTPEQLAAKHRGHHGVAPEVNCAESFLRDITGYGYVIVHEDDVPESQITWMNEHSHVYDEGWNDCRDRIFGEQP